MKPPVLLLSVLLAHIVHASEVYDQLFPPNACPKGIRCIDDKTFVFCENNEAYLALAKQIFTCKGNQPCDDYSPEGCFSGGVTDVDFIGNKHLTAESAPSDHDLVFNFNIDRNQICLDFHNDLTTKTETTDTAVTTPGSTETAISTETDIFGDLPTNESSLTPEGPQTTAKPSSLAPEGLPATPEHLSDTNKPVVLKAVTDEPVTVTTAVRRYELSPTPKELSLLPDAEISSARKENESSSIPTGLPTTAEPSSNTDEPTVTAAVRGNELSPTPQKPQTSAKSLSNTDEPLTVREDKSSPAPEELQTTPETSLNANKPDDLSTVREGESSSIPERLPTTPETSSNANKADTLSTVRENESSSTPEGLPTTPEISSNTNEADTLSTIRENESSFTPEGLPTTPETSSHANKADKLPTVREGESSSITEGLQTTPETSSNANEPDGLSTVREGESSSIPERLPTTPKTSSNANETDKSSTVREDKSSSILEGLPTTLETSSNANETDKSSTVREGESSPTPKELPTTPETTKTVISNETEPTSIERETEPKSIERDLFGNPLTKESSPTPEGLQTTAKPLLNADNESSSIPEGLPTTPELSSNTDESDTLSTGRGNESSKELPTTPESLNTGEPVIISTTVKEDKSSSRSKASSATTEPLPLERNVGEGLSTLIDATAVTDITTTKRKFESEPSKEASGEKATTEVDVTNSELSTEAVTILEEEKTTAETSEEGSDENRGRINYIKYLKMINNSMTLTHSADTNLLLHSITDVTPSNLVYEEIVIGNENFPVLRKGFIGQLNPKNPIKISILRCKVAKLEPGLLHPVKNLEQIAITYNKLRNIPAGVFNGLPLRVVILQENHIKKIAPKAFNNMPRLEELDLSRNRLTNYDPQWFLNTPRLLQLFLSYNSIEYIPMQAFKNLNLNESFLELYLDFNEIKEVHDYAFAKKPTDLESPDYYHNINIKSFVLKGNQLQCLPEHTLVARNTILQKNRLSCNCLTKIAEWKKLRPDKRVAADKKCHRS